jgi:hypothetical protein
MGIPSPPQSPVLGGHGGTNGDTRGGWIWDRGMESDFVRGLVDGFEGEDRTRRGLGWSGGFGTSRGYGTSGRVDAGRARAGQNGRSGVTVGAGVGGMSRGMLPFGQW